MKPNRKVVLEWAARMTAALMIAGGAGCAHESVVSVDLGWPTDLPAAQAEARAQNKLVLIDFSGSDWCPDCALLARKVFASPEFKAYAQSNLALVDADFPDKKPQPDALKKANDEMRKQFKVEGFPTVLVLNSDGKVLDKILDASSDDPAQFIARLEKLKGQSK